MTSTINSAIRTSCKPYAWKGEWIVLDERQVRHMGRWVVLDEHRLGDPDWPCEPGIEGGSSEDGDEHRPGGHLRRAGRLCDEERDLTSVEAAESVLAGVGPVPVEDNLPTLYARRFEAARPVTHSRPRRSHQAAAPTSTAAVRLVYSGPDLRVIPLVATSGIRAHLLRIMVFTPSANSSPLMY